MVVRDIGQISNRNIFQFLVNVLNYQVIYEGDVLSLNVGIFSFVFLLDICAIRNLTKFPTNLLLILSASGVSDALTCFSR